MGAIATILRMLDRAVAGVASRWRNGRYRLAGVRMHGYCWLRAIEIPRDHHDISLDRCSLDRGVVLLCGGPPRVQGAGPKLIIGEGVYINRNTFLDVIESLEIGPRTAIGPGCYITDHDHGMDPGRAPLDQPMLGRPTRVGEAVWVGAGVTILKGVTVGDRAIVAAGSVVTRDVPPDTVVAGVPARVIKHRSGAAGPAPAPVGHAALAGYTRP
jgi:acetyltransferase-like isoleucine patch superfamily enzyme